MKGNKAYSNAIVLHNRLYQQSSNLTKASINKLYNQYLEMIRKAAYKGHIEAQYDLAQQYENMSFLGIPNPMHNPAKCIYWYSKACLNNHSAACNNLAALYELGEGRQKDLNKALQLYKKSADLGYSIGKQNYKKMLRDLAKGGMYNK